MKSKLSLLLIGGLLVLVGCCKKKPTAVVSGPTFAVSGIITGAGGQMVYLEHSTLETNTIVASCKLKQDGSFVLQAPAPRHPDFYRIRVDKQSLLLAVDSTEHIKINSSLKDLPNTQNIEGSSVSKQIAELYAIACNSSREEVRKHSMQIIVDNPRSLAAYYAVHLRQNGQYIWDISDAKDRRMYQAVATSFETWMPDYERTKSLKDQVLGALGVAREAEQQEAMKKFIESSENAFLEITLPDEKGKEKSLSDLRGKVIVLDYSAIEMEQSKAYIFELRELYNKYHKRGLEIYSISIDRSKLLWEDGVANLPWVNVFAGDNAIEVLTRYNVQSLPTLFLLDRKGNVQGRYTDFNQLETDIKKYL